MSAPSFEGVLAPDVLRESWPVLGLVFEVVYAVAIDCGFAEGWGGAEVGCCELFATLVTDAVEDPVIVALLPLPAAAALDPAPGWAGGALCEAAA